MEIVLSRILKYMNGCLTKDHLYNISLFIVEHYVDMEKYNLDRICDEGSFLKDEVLDLCHKLGFKSYESFHETLINDYNLRISQIRERMLNVDVESFFNRLDNEYNKLHLKETVKTICQLIFTNKRIILIGALYPMSISVELQTDFITFGKEVIQYHHFMKDIELKEDDIVIFMSATGRTLNEFINSKKIDKQEGNIILMTQNKKFNTNKLDADHVVWVPGKFDGIEFNYQIMILLDILRIYYFNEYYL